VKECFDIQARGPQNRKAPGICQVRPNTIKIQKLRFSAFLTFSSVSNCYSDFTSIIHPSKDKKRGPHVFGIWTSCSTENCNLSSTLGAEAVDCLDAMNKELSPTGCYFFPTFFCLTQ